MKRYTPLKRSGPITRRRARRVERTAEERQFFDWGHRQPCIVHEFSSTHVCGGAIQASHQDEGKGVGLKTADAGCVFMCAQAHAEWTENRGHFEGSKLLRRQTHRLYSEITLHRYWLSVADGGPF